MHSDIATLERVEILRDLRRGEFDCWWASTFCARAWTCWRYRSSLSWMPTRKVSCATTVRSSRPSAARRRNVSGQVIMYADKMTDSMALAIDEERSAAAIQMKYNEEHGIEPQTIRKAINDITSYVTDEMGRHHGRAGEQRSLPSCRGEEVLRIIQSMEDDMASASQSMDFEEAARLRDQVVKLRVQVEGGSEDDVLKDLKKNARKGSAYGNRRTPHTAAPKVVRVVREAARRVKRRRSTRSFRVEEPLAEHVFEFSGRDSMPACAPRYHRGRLCRRIGRRKAWTLERTRWC